MAGEGGGEIPTPTHVSIKDRLLGSREGRYLHSLVMGMNFSPGPICVSLELIQLVGGGWLLTGGGGRAKDRRRREGEGRRPEEGGRRAEGGGRRMAAGRGRAEEGGRRREGGGRRPRGASRINCWVGRREGRYLHSAMRYKFYPPPHLR